MDSTPSSSGPSTEGPESSLALGYRPLRPAPRRLSSSISPEEDTRQVPPKRHQISLACEACRRRKSKCNGARPQCSQCNMRGLECLYRESQDADYRRKFEQLLNSHPALIVFRAIQTRPNHEVDEIVKRIRGGDDPETIAQHLATADLLLQVRLVPETRRRYEFPYSAQLPSHLRSPSNGFIQAMMYEWNDWGGDDSNRPQPRSSLDERHKAQYLRPFHAASIADNRLHHVIPSRWTRVKADNHLMRQLLHAYLLQEYDWFTFFLKDYFLDDMLSGSTTFCSRLLVNAILAIGCHCYNGLLRHSELWNPETLGYQFLAEAKQLWEVEMTCPYSLTTLQAGLIMNTIFSMCGMDELSLALLKKNTVIAQDLDILVSTEHIHDRKLRHASDFTAWAFYHWQCLLSYQLMTVPVVTTPPQCRLPDPAVMPEWYGDIWLRYPSVEHLVSTRFSWAFKAKAELSVVLNEAILGGSSDIDGSSRAQRLENVAQKLKAWHSSLPDVLSPSIIVFPAQIKIHLHYYYVQSQIYQLMMTEIEAGSQEFSRSRHDIQGSVAECRGYFETLLRIYYLRHTFEHGNMMLTQFLSMLAFMALDKLKLLERARLEPQPSLEFAFDAGNSDAKATRAVLIIAQKGLYDQGKSFYVPQMRVREVLERTPRNELMALGGHIAMEEDEPGTGESRMASLARQCPVDVRRMAEGVEHVPRNWTHGYATMAKDRDSYDSIFGITPYRRGA